jgi:hypothetical protein
MAWLRTLMMATGWPNLLVELRDQRIVAIGDAPWLGTFSEVFRDTAR